MKLTSDTVFLQPTDKEGIANIMCDLYMFPFSLVNSSFLFAPPQVHCFTKKLLRKTLDTRTLHFNTEKWLKIWLVQFAPPISFHNFHVIKESFYCSIGIMSTETLILQEEKCRGNGFEYFGEANSTYQEA